MGNPQNCDDGIAKRYASSFNRKLSRSLWSCQRNVPPGNHRPDQNYLTPHNNLRDPSTKAGSFIARSSNRPVITRSSSSETRLITRTESTAKLTRYYIMV
jgi:hypothetical protein